jgi:hypothetical protein
MYLNAVFYFYLLFTKIKFSDGLEILHFLQIYFLLHQVVKTSVPYSLHFSFYTYQRHLLRDRRCGTTACPPCWAMGTPDKQSIIESRVEKNNMYWADYCRAAKAGQKSLVPARGTQRRKNPFHMYSLSPYLPQFQQ